MGTWNIDSDGNSFVDSDALSWGDSPADAMDEALKDIIAAFRLDLGRAPTVEELHAGLSFSAGQALKEDQESREADGVYTFAVISEWTFQSEDGGPYVSEDVSYLDARNADDAREIWETADAERKKFVADLSEENRVMFCGIDKVEVKLVSVEQVKPNRNRVKLEIVK